ncbi:phage capsid protein, partial [Salmonella enterica]|nr:phage capsid protein [Salmonella enterica]
MSHLKTDWLCVATEGDTVDGRIIKRQWIIDMGETYDYNHWVALIWPEHEDDYGNFGEVLEATWNDGEDGLARLYVSLCPNIRLIFANHEDQLLF